MPRKIRTTKKASYRELFLMANGMEPWDCFFCGGTVMYSDLQVHHKDEDIFNDELSNLVAIHPGCHSRLHRFAKVGFRHTAVTKQKISSANKWRPPIA